MKDGDALWPEIPLYGVLALCGGLRWGSDCGAGVMCENCQRLQERIDFLERALGVQAKMPWSLGLTPKETAVLQIILARNITTRDSLLDGIYGAYGYEEPCANVIAVYVSKLRKKLQPHGINIKNKWNLGYWMEPADKAKFRELMASDDRP